MPIARTFHADGNARFTRFTDGFSKKFDNHAHAVAIYFMRYNFVRAHKTPALLSGYGGRRDERLWSLKDMVKMLERLRRRSTAV